MGQGPVEKRRATTGRPRQGFAGQQRPLQGEPSDRTVVGTDIGDRRHPSGPNGKYTLKALLGKFSGLHLLAIMFTAFCQIDPTMETGADFSAEY